MATSLTKRVLKSNTFAWLSLIAWILLVLPCMYKLVSYSNKAGAEVEPPQSWPRNSALVHNESGYTLLVFLHPHCPCSSATVQELARITARTSDDMVTYAVFLHPANRSQGWTHSSLWEQASALPGVMTYEDNHGSEITRFGVNISGHALLFDPHGRLCFSGGITAGRGHEGDNAGKSAVIQLVRGEPASCSQTPVFGCELKSLTTTAAR